MKQLLKLVLYLEVSFVKILPFFAQRPNFVPFLTTYFLYLFLLSKSLHFTGQQ